MIIGYARVSTDEQKLDLQIEALKACGCERIFTDLGESGYKFDRGGLSAAMRVLEPGGTLVVWRLDRWAALCPVWSNFWKCLATSMFTFDH